jgi:hypothetical protein
MSSRAIDGTPQKRDGRPSPEQVNSLDGDVSEVVLFHLVCAQETERKNSSFAARYVVCLSQSTEGLNSLYIRGRSRKTFVLLERQGLDGESGEGRGKGQKKLLSSSPCYDNFPHHTERERQN